MSKKPTPGMVTGGAAEPILSRLRTFLLTKKGMTTAGIIGVMLVIGSFGAWYFWPTDSNTGSQTEQKPVNNKKVNEAFGQAYQGDYGEAQKSLDESIAQSTDAGDKATGYMAQSALAMNAKKYDEALQYAQKAEETHQSYRTIEVLGDIAMAQGDKAAALKYYQEATARLEEAAKTPAPGIPQDRKTLSAKVEAAKS